LWQEWAWSITGGSRRARGGEHPAASSTSTAREVARTVDRHLGNEVALVGTSSRLGVGGPDLITPFARLRQLPPAHLVVGHKVESNGSWTIVIKPIGLARVWNPTKALSGKGDDVARLVPPSSGLAPVTITHRGSSNFAVTAYTADGGDLLVNEIGNYSGEVPMPDGTLLLSVEADGAWTVTPSVGTPGSPASL
jgi:hypothetical protein